MKKPFLSRRRFLYRLGAVAVFGALVVAGCGDVANSPPSAETAAQPPPQGSSAASLTQTAPPAETAAPVETSPTAGSVSAAAQPSPTVELTFHPTDPASVQLGAGRPQFVEFFAFW